MLLCIYINVQCTIDDEMKKSITIFELVGCKEKQQKAVECSMKMI